MLEIWYYKNHITSIKLELREGETNDSKRKLFSRNHFALRINQVCALLGPRQCGKTTLAKQGIQQQGLKSVHFFDLEDPDHLNAFESPKLVLDELNGMIVIDEVIKTQFISLLTGASR